MIDLLTRLRAVESNGGTGDGATNWHRNPDGHEAAEVIERLTEERDELAQRLSNERGIAMRWRDMHEIAIKERDEARACLLDVISMAKTIGRTRYCAPIYATLCDVERWRKAAGLDE